MYYWEKFCTSVLNNDVMFIATIFLTVDQLFSIQHKIPVKYNIVLLVANQVAEIS